MGSPGPWSPPPSRPYPSMRDVGQWIQQALVQSNGPSRSHSFVVVTNVSTGHVSVESPGPCPTAVHRSHSFGVVSTGHRSVDSPGACPPL